MADQIVSNSLDDERSMSADQQPSSCTHDEASMGSTDVPSADLTPAASNAAAVVTVPSKPNMEPATKAVATKEEKSGGKSAKVKKAKAGSKYTFFVGPGNNGELVRATLERRPWWELGKEDDPELNLKWLQVCLREIPEQTLLNLNRAHQKSNLD